MYCLPGVKFDMPKTAHCSDSDGSFPPIGDTLFITGTIGYSSSKDTKLKFSLHQKIVYRAYASTNISDLRLCKMVGDTIQGNSEETFSCQMKIPDDAVNTVQNCEIIFVEHYVKVLLVI